MKGKSEAAVPVQALDAPWIRRKMSAVQADESLMVSVHLCFLLFSCCGRLPAALSKGLGMPDTRIPHVHHFTLVHHQNLVSVTQLIGVYLSALTALLLVQ